MRTMIVLTDNQHALAKRKATHQGISLSEYIRRLIDRDLEEAAPAQSITALFGLFDDGGSNIAAGKQAMISDAINKQFAEEGL